MVLIEFPDRATEIKGLAFLVGRFSGKVLKGGRHIVPEAALDYAAVVDADTLQPVQVVRGPTLLALAVKFGGTRLIDNALI